MEKYYTEMGNRIKKSMIDFGADAFSMAELLGMSLSTWYRRMESPETFTFEELHKMSRFFKWQGVEV